MRRDSTPRKTLTIGAVGLAAAVLTLTSTDARAQSAAPAPPPPGFEPSAAPPPQPGYAPPGAYPPAGGYYVPPSVAASGPRRITDWEEGEPIPAGYHPVSRIRTGLVVGGAVTFGVVYLSNVLAAVIHSDACKSESLHCDSSSWNALYAPVVGPFIQIGHTSSATGNFFLVIDGLLQAAGVGMLIGGLAAPKTVLVRNDLAKRLELTPVPMTFGQNSAGFGFVGKF